ncbi:MAG: glutamate-cysteine ligase family protein [Coriobacteriia bacterium]|nr:glutamate-cysteine ligase family protein [Coriobacteriia bacterium]
MSTKHSDSDKATYQKNFQKFIDYFKSGEKSPENFGIGLELEMFVFDGSDQLINYTHGIKDLLEALKDYFSAPSDRELIIDDQLMGFIGTIRPEDILGTQAEKLKDIPPIPVSITLEPASQFEISVGPCSNLELLSTGIFYTNMLLNTTVKKMGKDWTFIRQGYNPIYAGKDLEIINKKRYHLMDAHFKTTGKHGIDMMRGSASTQISIDYKDEADFVKKFRMAYALGPIFSLMFDNARAPKTSDLYGKTMVRSHIWRDVDPDRSGIVPQTFDEDFGYKAYAQWLMDMPAIVLTDDEGVTHDTKDKTIGELISQKEISKKVLEHYVSMPFPDVRLKNYVEIRDVDSLPYAFALALAAMTYAIYYDEDTFEKVAHLISLDTLSAQDVYNARSAAMEDGYQATMYGHTAHELAQALFDLAYKALENEDDRALLEPMRELIERGLSPYLYVEDDMNSVNQSLNLEHIVKDAQGDLLGFKKVQEFLDSSPLAQRAGQTLSWTFTPKLYSQKDAQNFKNIAEKTLSIMEKATNYYLEHEDYRKRFDIDKDLEELCLIDTHYDQIIPIARVDIFYDELSGDFKFCELNTDGTSGVAFQRAVNEGIKQADSFKTYAQGLELTEYTMVDQWMDTLIACYQEFVANTNHLHEPIPHFAIVDFTESVMSAEVSLYAQELLDKHQIEARFVDIRDLRYENHELTDADGWRIDAVWRRAVTSEIFEKFSPGAQALIDAFKAEDVCLIGGFRTHPSELKSFLPILTSDASEAFLDEDEREFIREHTPKTLILREDFDLAEILSHKNKWIIKPADSYGGSGVFAGKDFSARDWEELVRAHAATGHYVVQEYIEPFKSYAYVSSEQGAAGDYEYRPHSNLVGLYVFGGRFAGLYSRLGEGSTITSHSGQVLAASFIVS